MKQVPPAHKSGTAGCINLHADAGPLTRQIDDYYTQRQGMNTTQRGKLASAIGKAENAEQIKTALEASKDVLAPYPQEPWESRYKRLVGALKAYCDSSDLFYPTTESVRVDIMKLIKENS